MCLKDLMPLLQSIIFFINNSICATHLAKEKCLMKESEITVKQILTVLHQSDGGRVVIIKNNAYLRENFLS